MLARLPQEPVVEEDPLFPLARVVEVPETLPALGASWTLAFDRQILVNLIHCGNHFRL